MKRKNPLSPTHLDKTIESHGETFDARFRLTRMLYPYEYWCLPMQEERCRDGLSGEGPDSHD